MFENDAFEAVWFKLMDYMLKSKEVITYETVVERPKPAE